MVPLVSGVIVGVGVGVEQEVGAVESLDEGVVIGGNAVRVEQLARVEGVVAGLLQPNGEPVVVEPLRNELGVSSYMLLALLLYLSTADRSQIHTPWRPNIRYIRVMRLSPRPETHARRTTQRRRHEMVRKVKALLLDAIQNTRRVRGRIELQVLVVRQQKEEVGRFGLP